MVNSPTINPCQDPYNLQKCEDPDQLARLLAEVTVDKKWVKEDKAFKILTQASKLDPATKSMFIQDFTLRTSFQGTKAIAVTKESDIVRAIIKHRFTDFDAQRALKIWDNTGKPSENTTAYFFHGVRDGFGYFLEGFEDEPLAASIFLALGVGGVYAMKHFGKWVAMTVGVLFAIPTVYFFGHGIDCINEAKKEKDKEKKFALYETAGNDFAFVAPATIGAIGSLIRGVSGFFGGPKITKTVPVAKEMIDGSNILRVISEFGDRPPFEKGSVL